MVWPTLGSRTAEEQELSKKVITNMLHTWFTLGFRVIGASVGVSRIRIRSRLTVMVRVVRVNSAGT